MCILGRWNLCYNRCLTQPPHALPSPAPPSIRLKQACNHSTLICTFEEEEGYVELAQALFQVLQTPDHEAKLTCAGVHVCRYL